MRDCNALHHTAKQLLDFYSCSTCSYLYCNQVSAQGAAHIIPLLHMVLIMRTKFYSEDVNQVQIISSVPKTQQRARHIKAHTQRCQRCVCTHNDVTGVQCELIDANCLQTHLYTSLTEDNGSGVLSSVMPFIPAALAMAGSNARQILTCMQAHQVWNFQVFRCKHAFLDVCKHSCSVMQTVAAGQTVQQV